MLPGAHLMQRHHRLRHCQGRLAQLAPSGQLLIHVVPEPAGRGGGQVGGWVGNWNGGWVGRWASGWGEVVGQSSSAWVLLVTHLAHTLHPTAVLSTAT
jgi:hypothetical protein